MQNSDKSHIDNLFTYFDPSHMVKALGCIVPNIRFSSDFVSVMRFGYVLRAMVSKVGFGSHGHVRKSQNRENAGCSVFLITESKSY